MKRARGISRVRYIRFMQRKCCSIQPVLRGAPSSTKRRAVSSRPCARGSRSSSQQRRRRRRQPARPSLARTQHVNLALHAHLAKEEEKRDPPTCRIFLYGHGRRRPGSCSVAAHLYFVRVFIGISLSYPLRFPGQLDWATERSGTTNREYMHALSH